VRHPGTGGPRDRTDINHSTRHRCSVAIDTRTQTAYSTLRTYQQVHVNKENERVVSVDLPVRSSSGMASPSVTVGTRSD